MIDLTDYALMIHLERELGFDGVFAKMNDAQREYKKRHTELCYPMFSLFWTNSVRNDTRFNRAAVVKGGYGRRDTNAQFAVKVQVFPVILTYDLNMWFNKEIEALDAMRDLYFLGVEKSAITIVKPEWGITRMVIPIDFDFNMNMDKGPETEEGVYFNVSTAFTVQTFFVKGLDNPIIRKITTKIYSYSSDDLSDAVLDRTMEAPEV